MGTCNYTTYHFNYSAYEKDIISGGKEETILILMDHSPFQVFFLFLVIAVLFMYYSLSTQREPYAADSFCFYLTPSTLYIITPKDYAYY